MKIIKKIKRMRPKKIKELGFVFKIVGIIIFLAVIVTGGYYYTKVFLPKKEKEKINNLAQQALKYINENLLAEGYSASLISASKESGVIKIKIKIDQQEFDSYLTLDGKYFFPTGMEMDKKITAQNESGQGAGSASQPKSCDEVSKKNSPLLEAFVVSQCPFGVQMQRILAEIVKEIPQLKDYIKVEYLGAVEGNKVSSMHGQEEAQENLRQVCIREEQKDKYWNYISCYIKKGEVQNCLSEAGINVSKLNKCIEQKGVDYIKNDFANQDRYGVSGSPTLVLNGNEISEFDFGGRTAQAVKTLLCCGFDKIPNYCQKELNTSQAATGFSESYSGRGSSGSCQ